MGGIFEALGEPVRRRILETLASGERPAGEIAAALQPALPMSQPAVSQHPKVLREAGLVQVRAEGTRRLYSLDQSGLAAAQAWLIRLARPADPLAPFEQPLDALATEIARGRRSRRAASPAQSRPGNTDGAELDKVSALGSNEEPHPDSGKRLGRAGVVQW